MGKKLWLLITCMIVSTSMAFAQTTVSGTVVSKSDGEPVIGAAIKVIGTSVGTVSDVNGRFSLNLPAGAKEAEVSYVGMITQNVILKNGIRIVLSDDVKALDEVMVIAYGTQKKNAFTGSASVVKSEELEKIQATNAVDALKGKASGIQIYTATGQPGMEPTIRIRGINSINAGTSPLIVVDGSPFDGNLTDINPIDVESMTVLKDAASTALYGARGGNGVILITTKGAQKGQPAKITFDAKWGSNSRAIPNYEMISDPAKHYEMWYSALNNYATNIGGMDANAAWQWANANLIDNTTLGLGYNVFNTPQGQYLIGQNGRLNPNATLGNVITNSVTGEKYYITPDDWMKETYGNSLRQEYTVSATGANDKSNFYVSANYLNNNGIVAASDFNRFTARMKADYMLKDWLKVGGNVAYAHTSMNYLRTDEDGDGGSSGNAFAMQTMAPIYPMYVRDQYGNYIYDQKSGMNLYDYGDRSIIGLYRPYLSQANPVSANKLDTRHNEGNMFDGTGTLEFYLPYGFKFYSINNVYLTESRLTTVTNPYFGQYASSNGIVNKTHDRYLNTNFQQRLNWHQQYGKNDIEVMIGHEWYKRHYYYLYAGKQNMFSQSNKELDGAVINGSMSSYTSEYNTEQWLGRGMYNYDEKYFGSVSLVRQASSRFSKNDGKWWGTFWSFGAGWLINKENWFKASWVDELKLKASYGENGNDQISNYLYTNRYSIVNSSDQVSLVPSTTMGNEDITWETNAKFNIGVDFSLFKGRLTGTIEYYSNKTKDMLFSFPLPPTLGYTNYYANIGDALNYGLEMEFNGDIIRNNNLTWSAHLNFTTNHNEITRLPDERKTQKLYEDGLEGYSSGSYFYAEGQSIYNYYTKMYAGVVNQSDIDAQNAMADDDPFKTNYTAADLGKAMYYKTVYSVNAAGQQLDEDGNLCSESGKDPVVLGHKTTVAHGDADYHAVGDVMPDVYGGFGTSLSYKGFDFSVDFIYSIGGKVYDGTYAGLMGCSNGHAFSTDMLNAWTPTNTNTDVPRLQYGDSYMNSGSDRFLTNASYLTLHNITLGYTLPKSITSKLGIDKVRVYAVGDNLWTWSKRQGLNPAQSITGSNSGAYYSSIRTISGGISLTF